MNDQELEVVKEKKDIGVVFTKDLKSSGQRLAAYKMESRVLGIIWRTIVSRTEQYCYVSIRHW